MLKGIPRNQSAKTPPIADNGMAVKIKAACFILLKVKNNNTIINPKAIGKATESRLLASTKFSNCPPYVT